METAGLASGNYYLIWKNEKGLKHSYNGVCSITCFPVFYAVEKNNHAYGGGYESVLKRLTKD